MINKSAVWLLLMFFFCSTTYSQSNAKLATEDVYMPRYRSYSPANFYIDKKFYDARHLPDSIYLQARTPDDLKQIGKSPLSNRVYGVQIDNADDTDLVGIFDELANFKNLITIEIRDLPLFFPSKRKPYQLPESITALKQVKIIDLHSAQSIDMEDAINKFARLPNLKALFFNGYDKKLPLKLFSMDNITSICISAANIDGINIDRVKWRALEFLGNAPHAGADEKALLQLKNVSTLKRLNIRYGMLGNCEALSQLKQVTTLSLSTCKADKSSELFEKLGRLINLEALSVSGLPDTTTYLNGIDKLVKLRSLGLMYVGSLASHPQQLQALRNLKNLETLNLNSNKLKVVPDVFAGLRHLKNLTISGNDITEVPTSIFGLHDLLYLDLTSNKLKSLPQNIAYDCKKLKKLNLNFNALTTLPPAIITLSQLEYLDVRANALINIPAAGWENLAQLKYANFSMNHLSVFPDGLQQIIALETLDVSTNNISSIGDLQKSGYKMKDLDLNSNDLTILPEHIGAYTQLETFKAAGNMLSDLPESFGNCVKLKEIDLQSESRKMWFDANKTGQAAFSITQKNNVHLNNIKHLPEGLKNAVDLYKLNIDNNLSIDGESVFKVILGAPRPYLNVSLENDNITYVPASSGWANMEFHDLDLRHNKITTLPPDFANIKKFNDIDLTGNPIRTNSGVAVESIGSHEDMKLLFDEMGIDLPNFKISAAGYAMALAKRVSVCYSKKQYTKAVEYADRAIKLDPAAYANQVKWDEIGMARVEVKDNLGAINDLHKYVEIEAKSQVRIVNFIQPVEIYLVRAYLALGDIEKAADTRFYFAKTFDMEASMQEAALLYKKAGNNKRYHELVDTALLNYRLNLEASKKRKDKYVDQISVLDYAELLIIAEKPDEAVKVLSEQDEKTFSKDRFPIKNYLMASASFLANPDTYEQVKQTLANDVKTSGKVTGWDFDMFNSWVDSSGMPKARHDELMALQSMVR